MKFNANSKLIMQKRRENNFDRCARLTLKSFVASNRQTTLISRQEEAQLADEKVKQEVARRRMMNAKNNKLKSTKKIMSTQQKKHKIKSKMSYLMERRSSRSDDHWLLQRSTLVTLLFFILFSLTHSALAWPQFLQPLTMAEGRQNGGILQSMPHSNYLQAISQPQPVHVSSTTPSSSRHRSPNPITTERPQPANKPRAEVAKHADSAGSPQQSPKQEDNIPPLTSRSSAATPVEPSAPNVINVDSPPSEKISELFGAPSGLIANISTPPAQQTNERPKVVAPSSQTLKPKTKADAAKQQAASAEQQIINQHAGFDLLHSQDNQQQQQQARFQHLSPVKQKSSTSLVSSVSDQQQQTRLGAQLLTAILDSFKSSGVGAGGASSRSSIVKAISDNKLARTISEVGKSISGNKYIASAALASVVAALGLSISKLFGNPLGGYSKLGSDPMLGSDSMLRPQHQSPAAAWFAKHSPYQTDRTQFAVQPGFYPVESTGGGRFVSGDTNQWQNGYQNSAEMTALMESASNVNTAETVAPTYNFQNPSFDPSLTVQAQSSPQVHFTYNPQPTTKIVNGKQILKPLTASEAGGHYAAYYAHYGANGADPTIVYSQQAGNMPISDSTTHQLDSNLRFPTNSDSETGQQGGHVINNNELFQSGSVENPIFADVQQGGRYNPKTSYQIVPNSYQPASAPSSSTSRRSGPVTLKLNEETKARLYQQLKKNQDQPKMNNMMNQFSPMKGNKGVNGKPQKQLQANPNKDNKVNWEPNLTNGNSASNLKPSNGDHHASMSSQTINKQGQQRQQQHQLGYQIIMPMANGQQVGATESAGATVSEQQESKQQAVKQTPEAVDSGVSINTAPHSSSAWKSFSSQQDQQAQPQAQAQQSEQNRWHSVSENGKQTTGASEQQLASDSKTQANTFSANGASAANANEQLLHRVSRTPPKANMKRPSDYDESPIATFSDDKQQATKVGSSGQSEGKQQQQQQQQQQVEEEMKTSNLIQLSAHTNLPDNSNNAKVIENEEPNENEPSQAPGKSVAAFDSPSGGLVIMLPNGSSHSNEDSQQTAPGGETSHTSGGGRAIDETTNSGGGGKSNSSPLERDNYNSELASDFLSSSFH